DLEFPGLEKVKRAVGAGDWAKAKSELADYYRNRKGRFFPFDPKNPAEGYSARRLRLAGEALVNRTGEFGPEMWTEEGHFRWAAARMRMKERTYFFESFGRAAALEKEGKVAAALMGLARDFAAEYQSGPERRGSMWSAMNVGIRMRSGWPVAFLALADSEAIPDEDLVLYLKSVWDQTTHLRKNASETSNWLTFEMAGLYTSGILYPEFKNAEEWRRFACETAIRDLERGWLPD